MSNSYFKFKQFTVHQERAAMKVGTDGILLGAWAQVAHDDARILDVGTGTGLIALMVAQRSHGTISAIDSDSDACSQATENAHNSPWVYRIKIQHTALQLYESTRRFDVIICNPPFYQHASGMTKSSRSRARHGVGLSYIDLIVNTRRLLTPSGRLSLILPSQFSNNFASLAEAHGLYQSRICNVYPKPGAGCKRHLMEFTACQRVPAVSELTLETEVRHTYTPAFRKLTADYYLAH